MGTRSDARAETRGESDARVPFPVPPRGRSCSVLAQVRGGADGTAGAISHRTR